MICSLCGTTIQDDARFCYNCGHATGSGSQQSDTAYQQADNTTKNYNTTTQQTYTTTKTTPPPASNNPGVTFSITLVYPNGRSDIGDLVITSNELIFMKKSKGVLLAFGLLGRALQQGTEALRISFSDVVSGGKIRYGINPHVYQITLRNGEAYKIAVDRPKMISHLKALFG